MEVYMRVGYSCVYDRTNSTLPYHTQADPTRILHIFTTPIKVIPYSKSVNPPYCCTVLYPIFTKTFLALPIIPPTCNVSYQALLDSNYQYQYEMGYSMVEWGGMG